jgi:16S rRNA C967 or C1407 C5-methylase (RsmB/RsmF family)
MPRPLPADGPKVKFSTRWGATRAQNLKAEADRLGVPPTAVVETAFDRFMSLSPATRERLLASASG